MCVRVRVRVHVRVRVRLRVRVVHVHVVGRHFGRARVCARVLIMC